MGERQCNVLNSDRWFCGLMSIGQQCRAIQDGTLVDWDGDCGFLFGRGTERPTRSKRAAKRLRGIGE